MTPGEHRAMLEPLPTSRRSSPVGEVGAETFFVRYGGEFAPESGGTLHSRVNDRDEGPADNAGMLRVQVVP